MVRAKEEYKDGTVKYYYYTYDAGGNIISELVHDNDKNEDDTGEYVYDAVWRDKLISYNGNEIIYDDCGNPKKYLGYDMSWDTSSGSLRMVSNSDHSYEYSYFSDGQRLSKDVDGKKTVYIYNAGMLLAQETDEYRLNFYYDADGLVTEIGYQEKENGEYSKETYYFYTRNGQGDIIGIYRCSDSTLVGTYEYDLWGNPVSKTENVFTTTIKKKEVTIRDEQGILDKNPLRYRGYYYDEETGFYYLNARYYDPKVHRFISADSQIAGVSSDVNGFNLFAYCDNDPVNKIDDSGMWPQMSNEQKIGCGLAIVATIALAAGIAAIAPELGISACALQTVFFAAVLGQAFCAVAVGAISAGIAYMNGADADEIWQAAYDSAADAFLGGTIIGGAVAAIAGGIGATACFLAGTPVNAENGKVPIENVKPGDMVLSEDPETGDVEYKRVLEVYINESTELVHLIIDEEEIITTPSHPFYVKDRGFVPAGELSEHSVLVDSEGNELHLQTVRWEHLQSPIHVYNFAVEDYHTYFVGNIEVLVHNTCGLDDGYGAYSNWNQGSYDSIINSLEDHFIRHGDEVGADSVPDYYQKALNFLRNLRGATGKPLDGFVEGATRFMKNGKYIDVAPDGTIISFGLIDH